MEMQVDFDRHHKGRNEFFELISNSNIEVLEHLVVCLAGEVGEFANIVKKISRGDFTVSESKEQISSELADILIYLLKIFAQLQIDPERSFLKKSKLNEKKFCKYRKL